MKIVLCFFLLVVLKGFSQIENLKKAQDQRKTYIDPSAKNDKQRKRMDFTKYVRPLIGTGAHGHTFPGAVVPFGMMQLSPDTRYNGWDGCSGYHYSDSVIYGFSHTHLSGTGVEDLCDLLIVPQQGSCNPIPGYISPRGYGSSFSHRNEKAEPGYYEVSLDQDHINVRLSASERSGIHEYTFTNKKGKKFILIDLDHRDQLLGVDLTVLNDSTVLGSRRSSSWAKNQRFFFYLKTNLPFEHKFFGKNKVCLIFPPKTEKLILKVGISAVDSEGAKNNLFIEIPDYDFEKVRMLAKEKWNKELNKIHFVSPDTNVMINFYTAQYHSYLTPIIFSDVDGRYRGNDDQIHQDRSSQRYSIFSIWDTYRTAHPLYTITQQKRTNDFITSFLGIYDETKELPVWELWGNETDCMIGYHATSIILDAYRKKIRRYDASKALEAMLVSSQKKELGKNFFNENEFIGSNEEAESVSKTLEYAYDDWCISEFARELGNDEISRSYLKNSYNFINLLHPDSKFMQARRGGVWVKGFHPSEVNFNFTEANSWQYSLATPQHIDLHRRLLGGKDSLETWLNRLFVAQSKLEGRQQADITGLIGQYAHGNEPSHHMAYLYNYTNTPYKTQERVDQILKEMYQPVPEGLSGNEDCGQMSAWYVMSAIGLYPVCPGKAVYSFGRPLQEYAGIHLENGKSFYVRTENNSANNKYIQSISLNGKKYEKLYLSHDTIMSGGELIFQMGSQPNPELREYESEVTDAPEVLRDIIPVPYFTANSEIFKDELTFEIKTLETGPCTIKYTLDGSEPTVNSKTYTAPITLKETTTVKAKTFKNEKENGKKAVSSTFYKTDGNASLHLATPFANQYAAGGDQALIDGIKGSDDFRSGEWQGFEGNDANGLIVFKEKRDVSEISFSCLQDTKSWIFMPQAILLEISTDGEKFEALKAFEITSEQQTVQLKKAYTIAIKSNGLKAIRFSVKNLGVCPKGYLGEGEKAWLFMDEIEIR